MYRLLLLVLLFACTKEDVRVNKDQDCKIVISFAEDPIRYPGQNFKPDTIVYIKLEYVKDPAYGNTWIIRDPEGDLEVSDPSQVCQSFRIFEGRYHILKSCNCN